MEFDRRQILAALTAPILLSAAAKAALSTPSSLVITKYGPIEGRFFDGAHEFKGIPYGASTAVTRRFMPPSAPTPWGTLIATLNDGPASPQSPPGKVPLIPESEDCLKLNVWTPALRDGEKRPVMVWLHGGGLWRSSAAGAFQSGHALAAKRNVVMVSPNHRLGILGHTYFAEFDAAFDGSASAGMLDLVQALQWLRDNIEQFGGDPNNVTIFGQSGGGQKVSLLMAMPAAHGLFHKAIIQSGPAPLALEKHYGRELASRLLHLLNIPEKRAADAQMVPVAAIMQSYYEIFREIGGFGVMGVIQDFAPVVDGTTLPQHPFWNGASPLSRNVPLMIGTTRTEMSEYALEADPKAWQRDFVQVTEQLRPIFADDAGRIVDHYRSAHPRAGAWEVDQLIRADWPTRLFSRRIADEQAKLQGAPVWMYRMDWETDYDNGRQMAPHAIDIPFVLDTVGTELTRPGQMDEQRQMVRQMSDAWVSFARFGRPSSKHFPHWTPYDSARRPTLLFNVRSRVENDPAGSDLEILSDGLTRYRVVAGGVTANASKGEYQ
ncbi:MAG: carboxylesterase family protein [Pseudomonadota bacterium]